MRAIALKPNTEDVHEGVKVASRHRNCIAVIGLALEKQRLPKIMLLGANGQRGQDWLGSG